MGFSAAAVAKIRQIVKTVAKFKIGWKRSGTVVSLANSGDTVGIGTSDPVSHLEVASTDSVVSLTVRSDSANDAALDLIEETADSAGFGTADAYGFRTVYDGGTNKLLIKSGQQTTVATRVAIQRSDGAVGIGTDSPIAELDVAGKIAITAESSTPAQPSDGDGYLYSKSDGKIYWRSYDLSETDLTATGGGGGGTDVGWTGPSSGVISTTGSTGLGSTAPDRKLEITNGTTELLTRLTYNDTNGSATNYVDLGVDSGGAFIVSPSEAVAGSAAANWPIQLYAGGGSSNTIHLAIGGNEIQAKDDDSNAGDLYLQYHGGDMGLCDGGGTLTVGGKVGIGATSPGAQLEVEVADSENMAGLLIDFNETGGYTAFEVDSESTENYAAYVHGKYGMSITQDITSGRGLKVSRNIDETGSLALVYFHNDHISNTRPTLIAQQDGTGDIISLYSGSSEVVTFTNEGKLGIGDTTPDAQLEVFVADAAATKGLLVDFNETSGYAAFHVDSESTTHYTAWLQGKYGAYIEQDITSGHGLKVTRDISETGSLPLVQFHDDNSSNTQTTLQVRQDGTGDILNLLAGSTEVMTVTDNGNLGVGTEPIVNVHVEDSSGPSFYLTRDDSTIGADDSLGGIAFGGTQDSGTSYDLGAWIIGRASSTWTSGSDTPTYLQFYTTPDGSSTISEAMRLTSEGRLGIGQTSPAAKVEIEVADSENVDGLLIDFNETGNYNALVVDSEAAYPSVLVTGKYGAYIEQDISSGYALKVIRNIDEGGSEPLALFHDSHTSNTQTAVQIRQDGTGDILNLLSGSSEILTVTKVGKLGIGKSAPEGFVNIVNDSISPLDDVGDPTNYHLHIQGSTTDDKSAGIAFGSSVANVGAAIVYKDIGDYAQGELQFYTKLSTSNAADPIKRLVITKDGDLGVGSAAPDRRLEITDGTNERLVRLAYNDTDGSAANNVDLGVDSGGALIISPSEGLAGDIGDNYPVQIYAASGYTNTAHLGLSSTDIQAKANDSTTAALYVQYWGGNTDICYGGGDTAIGGNLRLRGNTIKDSGNTTVLSFDTGKTGIGTTAPKVPLDLYEMGGLSVAMTHLMPASDTNYTNTTSYVVPTSDWKITFTAPANGKIEIMFSALIAMGAASDDYIFLGLSDNSTYNTLGAQYERHAYQASTGDNTIVEYSWLVTGLTAGTSYTYYVGSKYSGGGPAPAWYWGGTSADEYPPILIKALTVPDTIYTG